MTISQSRNLDIENRLTRVEDGVIRIEASITNLKENHLAHVSYEIQEVKDNQKWTYRFMLGTCVGIIVWLVEQVVSRLL